MAALHAETTGSGPPLVLVHGFTQSCRAWGPSLPALAEDHRVIAVDAPGHGRSADVAAGLWDAADLLVDAAGGRAAWIGYSMGGRHALHVALRHPDAVERLVLVSATAGIEDPGERAARRASDEALARRVESEGLASFVSWWLTQPMFAGLGGGDGALEGRLDGTAAGLASSLRLAGSGSQDPLWDCLGSIEMPVLVVVGELDAKYAAIGGRLADAIPRADLVVIPGAGHACHLERPDDFVAAVAAWLD